MPYGLAGCGGAGVGLVLENASNNKLLLTVGAGAWVGVVNERSPNKSSKG